MKALSKGIFNRVGEQVVQKLTDTAGNMINSGIDEMAVNTATKLGIQFAKSAEFNQQVIANYRSQQVVENPVTQPLHPQPQSTQPVYQEPQVPQQVFGNPFLNPQGLKLSVEPVAINKLDEEQVKRLAAYKTNMFFQINNIGKNTIRFLGQKFFSHNLEQSKQVVVAYEAGELDDVKAYKKAKFKLEKVAQLENMQDDEEQEKLFRDFVRDVILDEYKQKNERGELHMPSITDVAFQQFGFHAWAVFSPDLTLESYLGI